MGAAWLERLLYTIFPEEPFKNQIYHITGEKYYYTIYDYVSQNFGMIIGEEKTCLSCHKPMCPKSLNYILFILSLGEILYKMETHKSWKNDSFGQEMCYHEQNDR